MLVKGVGGKSAWFRSMGSLQLGTTQAGTGLTLAASKAFSVEDAEKLVASIEKKIEVAKASDKKVIFVSLSFAAGSDVSVLAAELGRAFTPEGQLTVRDFRKNVVVATPEVEAASESPEVE